MLNQMAQHKAGIAATVGTSSAVATWMEQANAWIDLAAGGLAIIATCLAIAWYVREFTKRK